MPKINLGFKVLLVDDGAIFCVDRAYPGRDFSTRLETADAEKALKMYNVFDLSPGERKRIVVKEGRKRRTIAVHTA